MKTCVAVRGGKTGTMMGLEFSSFQLMLQLMILMNMVTERVAITTNTLPVTATPTTMATTSSPTTVAPTTATTMAPTATTVMATSARNTTPRSQMTLPTTPDQPVGSLTPVTMGLLVSLSLVGVIALILLLFFLCRMVYRRLNKRNADHSPGRRKESRQSLCRSIVQEFPVSPVDLFPQEDKIHPHDKNGSTTITMDGTQRNPDNAIHMVETELNSTLPDGTKGVTDNPREDITYMNTPPTGRKRSNPTLLVGTDSISKIKVPSLPNGGEMSWKGKLTEEPTELRTYEIPSVIADTHVFTHQNQERDSVDGVKAEAVYDDASTLPLQVQDNIYVNDNKTQGRNPIAQVARDNPNNLKMPEFPQGTAGTGRHTGDATDSNPYATPFEHSGNVSDLDDQPGDYAYADLPPGMPSADSHIVTSNQGIEENEYAAVHSDDNDDDICSDDEYTYVENGILTQGIARQPTTNHYNNDKMLKPKGRRAQIK